MQGFDVGGSHKSQQSGYESLRHPEPGARRLRRRRSHRGRRRHRASTRTTTRTRKSRSSALGSDVEMNSGGAAIVTTIKSGGNTFKGLRAPQLRAGQLRRHERGRRRHRDAATLSDNARRHAVRQPEPAVLGGTRRSRRSDQEGQGLVLRRVQPLQDRQGGVGRRAERSRPISASSTTTPAKGTAKAGPEQHVHRLLPARAQAEAEARLVDAHAARIGPAQDSMSRMYKGEWQRVLSEPDVLQRQRRQLHARLADGVAGRSGAAAAAGIPVNRRG